MQRADHLIAGNTSPSVWRISITCLFSLEETQKVSAAQGQATDLRQRCVCVYLCVGQRLLSLKNTAVKYELEFTLLLNKTDCDP